MRKEKKWKKSKILVRDVRPLNWDELTEEERRIASTFKLQRTE